MLARVKETIITKQMDLKVPTPQTSFLLPKGFRWAGVPAGIKYTNRRDLGLFATEGGACSAAAVFTQSAFAAAPVIVSRELLRASRGRVQGGVVNSGNANAATGEEGIRNARRMQTLVARAFQMEDSTPFFVCSTGTIGVQLPMTAVEAAIAKAATNASATATAFMDFATSILTTDTRHKIASASFESDGRQARILACAKGSGMMQPKMATMLAFAFTDAQIAPGTLQECLSHAVERSLNCVTIDGDTSTNDTAILMASGTSGVSVAEEGDDRRAFEDALLEVLQSISKQLARDGEGATKLIEIEVRGATDFISARECALAVANSPLVKTAIYGRDANWGRIAMALGHAGVNFRVDDVSIRLGDLELFRKGAPLELDEDAALEILSQEFVRIEVEIGSGEGSATVWTCDLTEKYIEINGSYRT
jgi:glutamate N-acetyltransferase/amino-acid N-acetyltransferase